MRGRLAIAAFALLLAACPGSRERQQLEAEVNDLRAKRDKYAKIAEHLDEYREEIVRLEVDLKRVEAFGTTLSHEERIKKAGTIAGVTAKRIYPMGPANPTSPWELSGTGSGPFVTLFQSVGAIGVEKVVFAPGGAWTVTVPAWDSTMPYAYATPYATPEPVVRPRPKKGRFTSRRTLALHADAEALEKEIAELGRLIGEVEMFEQKKGELERQLGILAAPSRLKALSSLTARLFYDSVPECSSGSVVVSQQSVRFWCAPRSGRSADETVEGIREELAADGWWKLGSVSIDENATEPVQATVIATSPFDR